MNKKKNKVKEAKNTEELLAIWKGKHLLIPDKDKALALIARHNYYRLSGYAKYFYNEKRNFKENTTFDDIYNLYAFDRQLRSLVRNLTEEIELNFRSYIASYIATNFGPLGYLNSQYFFNKDRHSKFCQIVQEKVKKYEDKPFIKWNVEQYGSDIPIWILVEILSFTDLSYLYSNLKDEYQKNIIAQNYTSKAVVKNKITVRNWLHSICDVRNICAHSEKLFNLNTIHFNMPKEYKTITNNNTIFALLLICKELILDEVKWNIFVINLDNAISKYNFKNLSFLGFNSNWKNILKK